MFRHLALDVVDRDLAVVGAQDVGQAFLGHFQRDFATQQAGMGKQALQRAFQHADVGGDPMRQEFQNAGADFQIRLLGAEALGLGLQDAQAQFIGRGMQVHDQPAGQARLDAFLKALDLGRGAVGGNHDLLALVDQGVEGVEEFLLRAVLAGNELHVVHHQHVHVTEHAFEIHDGTFAQGLHEAVHELFRRQIQHLRGRMIDLIVMGDGVHQVRLAQAHAAIQEQGVEAHRPALGHAARGGMGQFVGFADDEIAECVSRIQRRAQIGAGHADGCGGCGGCDGAHGLGRCCRGGTGTAGCLLGHDLEAQAFHGGAMAAELAQDILGEVTIHPVRDEAGRTGEMGNARIHAGQAQGLDPMVEIVRSHACFKRGACLAPDLVHGLALSILSPAFAGPSGETGSATRIGKAELRQYPTLRPKTGHMTGLSPEIPIQDTGFAQPVAAVCKNNPRADKGA